MNNAKFFSLIAVSILSIGTVQALSTTTSSDQTKSFEAMTVTANDSLVIKIKELLSKDPLFTGKVDQIDIKADPKGEVTLSGKVESLEMKNAIESKVQAVPGIFKVNNQLVVAEPSSFSTTETRVVVPSERETLIVPSERETLIRESSSRDINATGTSTNFSASGNRSTSTNFERSDQANAVNSNDAINSESNFNSVNTEQFQNTNAATSQEAGNSSSVNNAENAQTQNADGSNFNK